MPAKSSCTRGVVIHEITEKDLLTPFEEFEKKHSIVETRNDISKKFLGFSPSRYYKYVDMDVEKLAKKVEKLFSNFSRHISCHAGKIWRNLT